MVTKLIREMYRIIGAKIYNLEKIFTAKILSNYLEHEARFQALETLLERKKLITVTELKTERKKAEKEYSEALKEMKHGNN